MGKILVIGATGNIGKYVVSELINKGEKVKAAVSTPRNTNYEMVRFDFLDTSTFKDALEGVDRVFLIRPPQLANPKKDMRPFLEACKQAGILQIVFVSLLGVEKNPIVPHRKIEDMITELGIPYTFLRPGFFMQNLSTTHHEEIRDDKEIFVPVGKAKTSFIDTRDIAAVAAACFVDEQHINQCYTLTGNKAIDYYEVADTLSDVIGKKIEYKNPGILEFRRKTIRRGVKPEFANVMTMLYFLTRMGTAERVTNDVEIILGRAPITFRQFALDHKDVWKKEPESKHKKLIKRYTKIDC